MARKNWKNASWISTSVSTTLNIRLSLELCSNRRETLQKRISDAFTRFFVRRQEDTVHLFFDISFRFLLFLPSFGRATMKRFSKPDFPQLLALDTFFLTSIRPKKIEIMSKKYIEKTLESAYAQYVFSVFLATDGAAA